MGPCLKFIFHKIYSDTLNQYISYPNINMVLQNDTMNPMPTSKNETKNFDVKEADNAKSIADSGVYNQLPDLNLLNQNIKNLGFFKPELIPQGNLKIAIVAQFASSGFIGITAEDIRYIVKIPKRFKRTKRHNRIIIGKLVLIRQQFKTQHAILVHVYDKADNNTLNKNYFNFKLNKSLFINDF